MKTKTIEERAKLASEGYDDDGYSAGLYMGYVEGAKEQKAIDIDKVCDWLRVRNVITKDILIGFRKAMEEE